MAPQFTRQSVPGHMILIATLLVSLAAFAVGDKQDADPGKSIFQGGAVSYSHVVHDYGPSYKYIVKSAPSSATVNGQYAGASASHGYATSSTLSPPVVQSTTGYAPQSPSYAPLSHTYAKPSKSPDAAYIQGHQFNRLPTSSPYHSVGVITTSPKYNINNNLVSGVSKHLPYPVFQPYSLQAAPYSVSFPVPVRTPYAVAVPKIYPVAIDKPPANVKQVPYPVKVPVVAQPIPVIVQYPLYLTTKAIIKNDLQGHSDYSQSLY